MLYKTLNQEEKQIIVYDPRFFFMKRKILRLEKVYDCNSILIHISIVEGKRYAVTVRHEAFDVSLQFDERNN